MHFFRLHPFAVCAALCLLAHTCLFGNTWYVDPVNGSDLYDGTSPFHIPDTTIGPTQTIDGALYMANQYDVLVLADGLYSGQYNTGATVFEMIDMYNLYVTSINGPENCILELYEQIRFFTPTDPPDELTTHFANLTFTSNTDLPPFFIFVENYSQVCFEDCVFTGFQGMYNLFRIHYSQPTFEGCQFSGNQINHIMRCREDGSPTITNCSFTHNTNFNDDPVALTLIRAEINPQLEIQKCVFSNNNSSASYYSIAIDSDDPSHFIVQDCVFKNNSAVEECIEISAFSSGGIINNTQFGSPTISSASHRGTGISCGVSAYLYVSDCQFYHNEVGIHLYETNNADTISIDHCDFIGNTGPDAESCFNYCPYGGILFECHVVSGIVDISIQECSFTENYAGITTRYDSGFGTLAIEHCQMTDNTLCGVDIVNTPENLLTIRNCTLANNGQFALGTYYALVESSILRQDDIGVFGGDPILTGGIISLGEITCNYCNVEGGWTGPGAGNIDVDPLFADAGYWNDMTQSLVPGTDYHLRSTAGRYDPQLEYFVQDTEHSPCIDAGDAAVVSFFESYGSGGRINMGAYGNTWQASLTDRCSGGYRGSGLIFGDINRDCRVNLGDLSVMAENWLQSSLIESPIPD